MGLSLRNRGCMLSSLDGALEREPAFERTIDPDCEVGLEKLRCNEGLVSGGLDGGNIAEKCGRSIGLEVGEFCLETDG